MKTHIDRAKTYLIMAETVISELRRELQDAQKDPQLGEDRFLELVVEARCLLKYALEKQETDTVFANVVNFRVPAETLIRRIDSVIGEELIFPRDKNAKATA